MNDVENCVLKLMSLTEKDRVKVMQVMDLLGVYEAPRIQECLAELAGMSFPEPGKAYDLVKKILVGAPEFPKAAEKPQVKSEQEFVPGTRYILDKSYKCILVRKEKDGCIVRCTQGDSNGDEIFVRSLERLELDHAKSPRIFRHTEAVHFFDDKWNKVLGNVVFLEGNHVRIAVAGSNAVRVIAKENVYQGW